MNFSDFNFSKELQEGLDSMGFETPTPIQKDAIPVIQKKRDLIACAQTGTGKTAAFVLPILDRKVNETTNLQAAIPVFEINRLTNLLGFGVQTINLIALIIILVSGLSIFITLYNSLKKRRYELALIRVHGATKWQLIKLVFLEGLTVSLLGTFFGLLISRFILFLMPFLVNKNQILNSLGYGLITNELWLIIIALFVGFLASLIPSFLVYKINIPKTLSNV